MARRAHSRKRRAHSVATEDWPTRVIGDPARWTVGGELAEECPVHEYLLDDGYCDRCVASDRPEKSVR